MIEVKLNARLGTFELNANFQVSHGITALFGPSGAGKTSLIRMIAGLQNPEDGSIQIGDQTFFSSEQSINLPVGKRKIGLVNQDANLFPHLSVYKNLTYANWAGNRTSKFDLNDITETLGISHLTNRQPENLSGGERQRVAIGRALCSDPSILLLDEPLSALDNQRKKEIIPFLELIRDQFKLPMIYISHSVDEITQLADNLILMDQGNTTDFGPIDEVLGRQNLKGTGYALEAGNLLYGNCTGIDQEHNLAVLSIEGQDIYLPAGSVRPGDLSKLRIRPSDVAIALERPSGTSIQNMLSCQINKLEQISSSHMEVGLSINKQLFHATITRRAASMLNLKIGLNVVAMLKAMALEVHKEKD